MSKPLVWFVKRDWDVLQVLEREQGANQGRGGRRTLFKRHDHR
jgi:hypothetical protein